MGVSRVFFCNSSFSNGTAYYSPNAWSLLTGDKIKKARNATLTYNLTHLLVRSRWHWIAMHVNNVALHVILLKKQSKQKKKL